MMKKQISPPEKPAVRFQPPPIPPDLRCDFRIDYDSGMTMKQIAGKYYCDQRTVKRCILLNKSSTQLGCQFAPTRLAPYTDRIRSLLAEERFAGCSRIMDLSRGITESLRSSGYTGSERTVRNYLKQHGAFETFRKTHSDPQQQ